MNGSYEIIRGSICLTDIPKELIRRVKCKDGVERAYLNVSLIPVKEPRTFQNPDGTTRTYTHYLSCSPKKEERREGVKYIIGDFETKTMGQGQGQWQPAPMKASANPFPEEQGGNELPF